MSEKAKSIYDGLSWLYAEQLKGKRVALTISAVVAEEVTGDGGRKDQGFAIAFKETDKRFVVTGATVRRQLALACGTDVPQEMVGHKVTLYPIKSVRSVSGQAIRVAIPETLAQ